MTSWMQLARVALVLALSLCAPEGPLYVEPPPALSGDDALWRDVGVGRGYACAVSGQGELRCWGLLDGGIQNSLDFKVKSVIGLSYSGMCVIDLQNHVQCVGIGYDKKEQYAPFGLLKVGKLAGFTYFLGLCALSLKGEVFCHHSNTLVSVWPGVTFDHLFNINNVLCGHVPGEGTRCEGDLSALKIAPDDLRDAVDVGVCDNYFCKINELSHVVCWSPIMLEPPMPPRSERFKQLAVLAPRGACGLSLEGELRCWGEVPPLPDDLGFFEKISIDGNSHAVCGLRVDGTLQCWGPNHAHQAYPPGERFVDASFTYSGCALRSNQELVCWGGFLARPTVIDDFRWTKVSVSETEGCGATDDGAVWCWAWGRDEVQLRPLDLDGGPFADFELGGQTRCGLGFNGGVECKGDIPLIFEPSAEDERIESLSVGYAGVCGVTRSKQGVCWLRGGVKTTLEGEGVTAVSSGAESICLLKGEGEVRCWYVPPWDERDAGTLQPPRGLPPGADKPGWTSLSCGVGCCGLDASKIPHCWGGAGWGEGRRAQVPKEPVDWIRLEGESPCWLRQDGDLECFNYIIR